jgi:hypothetical protein
LPAHRPYDSRELSGPTIRQVVAGHRGNDDVVEVQVGCRLGYPFWFVSVERCGPPVSHGTETALPRAGVAQDHKGRRASLKTLDDIRAACLLADRMQVEIGQQATHTLHRGFRRGRNALPKPGRMLQQ